MTVNFTEQTLSLEIRPSMAELGAALERLDEFWQSASLSEDLQADLNIAVEEILSNVIRHSGATEPVALSIDLSPTRVSVEVRDSGQPFDPLAHPMPNPNAPLAQRRAGGLGIFMILKLMTEVRYERRDGSNCLRMIRALS